MRLCCYINGILTFPGEAKNWTGRAVTYTHLNSEARAEKVEYWAGPIDRVFGQRGRAEKLFRTLTFYTGWDITLVGHSNGVDVILDMLRDYPSCPAIRNLHLVCGAGEADFLRNGLNSKMLVGKVGVVTVYCAGKDKMLALAHTIPGHLLGYGTIGLSGPIGVMAEVASRVRVVRWPELGHSDCWSAEYFDATMRGFLA